MRSVCGEWIFDDFCIFWYVMFVFVVHFFALLS